MKQVVLFITLFAGIFSINAGTNNSNKLFTTSKCFDMIASLQYFDKIKDVPQFQNLANDSIFITNLNVINDNVSASKLCNFYAMLNGDKNNVDLCETFFSSLADESSGSDQESEWIKNIIKLKPYLAYCLSAIKEAGYSEYWDKSIKPFLDNYINSYPVSDATLDSIHNELTIFSGPEELTETHSNIFVLNIDNAFNLSDESFCCTPLLLDKEMEKRFRLDFIKVYIHENLHRLSLSDVLMKKLEELKEDDFYRENEVIASQHGEGLNEAFVVAAEVFISHNIGHRDAKSVYDEFVEYVDGSLVLAPIIYVNLGRRNENESLSDFVLRLFDDGTIKIGSVQTEYQKAMAQIESHVQEVHNP